MIIWLAINLPALVAVASVLAIAFLLIARKSAQARRRTHHLESAGRLMKDHLSSMALVMDDDRVPLVLREKLLLFSETIFDREFFLDAVTAACDDERRGREAPSTRGDVLGELAAIDPALSNAFDAAVTAAITAMLFRVQEAGWILDDHLARVAMDSEKRTIFLHAIQRGRSPGVRAPLSHFAAVA